MLTVTNESEAKTCYATRFQLGSNSKTA